MANRYVSTLFESGAEFEDFLKKLDAFKRGVSNGTIIIPNATKATQDGDGEEISKTYAKTASLTDGTTTVKKASQATSATTANSATKATQDGDGEEISKTYAKTASLTDGTIIVKKASQAISANTANSAAKANAVITINGSTLNFFVGTKDEYSVLTEEEKNNCFAIITDDTAKEELDAEIEALKTYVTNVQSVQMYETENLGSTASPHYGISGLEFTEGSTYIFNILLSADNSSSYEYCHATVVLCYITMGSFRRVYSTVGTLTGNGSGNAYDGCDIKIYYDGSEQKLKLYYRDLETSTDWNALPQSAMIAYREI